MDSKEYFKTNSFVKIEKILDTNMCTLLYHHITLNATRLMFLEEKYNYSKNFRVDIDGTFYDKQAIGSYSRYGDPIFDTLLDVLKPQVEQLTGLKLIPTYSYHRLYNTGSVLEKHIDRASCEISTTLCIGQNTDNLKDDDKEKWNWPMFIKKSNQNNGIPVGMYPGDMIIYRGCEVEHWREPLIANNVAQVFLHYNIDGGVFNNINDGRPILGMAKEGKE